MNTNMLESNSMILTSISFQKAFYYANLDIFV